MMGRSIGSLGRQRDPLDLEFDYFGQTVRIHPHATDAVELEFLQAGRDIDMSALDGVDLSQVDAMAAADQARLVRAMGQATAAAYRAVLDALRRLIHPDDWDTYWRLGMENGQQIRDRMSDIKAITTAVVESTTDFPTGRPAASPTGPETTPPASTADSPSPAPASDLEVAMALERGRPDIQEFYLMQVEDKERAERDARERTARDQRQLAAAGLG
ncbi:hypothetical protein [Micromonospora tarensis]|uniref:Uncharacterized protein n=1 Tax=Micromonospora tarensis TaxID=2806100 RepID=A0ABS1YCG4_9ACTN|nr:hypothetical protein [Micromonospora tarensis]MBM0275093.1 hypothetical protein [Micromonospora tarensis]